MHFDSPREYPLEVFLGIPGILTRFMKDRISCHAVSCSIWFYPSKFWYLVTEFIIDNDLFLVQNLLSIGKFR